MISTLVQNDNSRKKTPTAFISEGLRSKLDVCCWYFSDSWIMFCCQTVLYSCWKYPDVSFTFGWVSTKIQKKKKYTKKLRNTADGTESCYIWFKSVSGWIFSLSYWQCLDLWQPLFFSFFFEWHENGVAIQIVMAHILVMSLKTFAYLLNCWIKMEPCPQLRMQHGAVEEEKKKKR